MILTKLAKADFEKILSQYDIGQFKSAKFCPIALETTVYFITTSKGKYVLKIFEDTSLKLAKFQLKIINLLTTKKFATLRLIKTKNGSNHITISKKIAFIKEFFEGKHPEKLNDKEVKKLGEQIAKLHLILSKVKKEKFLDDTLFMSLRDPSKAYTIPNFDVYGLLGKNLAEFKKLDITELKTQVIHGDLAESNILKSTCGDVVFIDWGDICIDYVARELAITIAYLFGRNKIIYRNQIKLFLAGYEKHIKLNIEEKKAIYYLAKHRLLCAIRWCYGQASKHPDREKQIISWTKRLLNKYRTLSKLSVDDFLAIINSGGA